MKIKFKIKIKIKIMHIILIIVNEDKSKLINKVYNNNQMDNIEESKIFTKNKLNLRSKPRRRRRHKHIQFKLKNNISMQKIALISK